MKYQQISRYIKIFAILASVFLYAAPANADEVKFFTEASVFAGVDYTLRKNDVYIGNKKVSENFLCISDNRSSNRLAGNVGIRLNVAEWKRLKLNAKASHLSCPMQGDLFIYDAVGFEVEWVFWKRH